MNVHRTALVLRNPVSYGGASLIGLAYGMVAFCVIATVLGIWYMLLGTYWLLRLTFYEAPRGAAWLIYTVRGTLV